MKLQQLKDQFKQLSGLSKTDSKTVRAYIKAKPEFNDLMLDLRRKDCWTELVARLEASQHGFTLDTDEWVEPIPQKPVKRSPGRRRRVSKRASELVLSSQIIPVKQPVKVEEEAQTSSWQSFPLIESNLDDDEKELIEWCCPSFDWYAPYTYKAHRQLFKALKARFRQPDGSLKHEVANEAVIILQQQLAAEFDASFTYTYEYNEGVLDLLLSEEYKLVA